MPRWALIVPLLALALLVAALLLPGQPSNEEVHAAPPSNAVALASFGLLLLALVAVVGLAKVLSPSIEAALAASGAPKTVLGIAIALLVLLPETVAAVRAAHVNRLQTSFNLAYGSALASIGLTIPAVAAASVWMGLPLVLGLEAKDSRAADADLRGVGDHAHLRSHAHDARRSASGDLRGVRVPCAGPVIRAAPPSAAWRC